MRRSPLVLCAPAAFLVAAGCQAQPATTRAVVTTAAARPMTAREVPHTNVVGPVAQPGVPGGGPRPGEWAATEPGRFTVVPAGGSAVLVDSASGKTWVLRHAGDGGAPVWLPAQRIDDPAEARKWLEKEHGLGHEPGVGPRKPVGPPPPPPREPEGPPRPEQPKQQ
jgi:hypothetical protein